MNKKLKNVLAVTGALTVAAAAVYGLNVWDEKRDRKRYVQSGRLVEVRGKKMHIWSTGDGSNTVVMIPGRGTPTPSIDYKPLADKLAESYKVVVPEPFGYGYSDATGEPRTVRNQVDEMREGLRKAGFFPPYVLMGHAAGGLQTLYWASHYPREVSAVVGIDTILPAMGNDQGSAVPTMGCSLCRLLSRLSISRFLIKAGIMDGKLSAYNGGSEENMPVVRAHAANLRVSSVAAGEADAMEKNCADVADLHYPASCPVLMLVSSESCDKIKNDPALGLDWMAEHDKIAMHAQKGKCVLLQGGHFLHHTAADAITAEVMAFVPAEEQQTPSLRTFLTKR